MFLVEMVEVLLAVWLILIPWAVQACFIVMIVDAGVRSSRGMIPRSVLDSLRIGVIYGLLWPYGLYRLARRGWVFVDAKLHPKPVEVSNQELAEGPKSDYSI